MKTPHKHAEQIHAWADGATIQRKEPDGWWACTGAPCWNEDVEYRVKREPLRYRNYLAYTGFLQRDYLRVVTEPQNIVEPREKKADFARWLGDWQEVEEN